MSELPFIKFFPGDFLAGTSGLSPAERGVYITLLCLIYENDGPIPRDDTRLARRCGAPKAGFQRIVRGLIEQGKLFEVDGRLMNRRASRALVDRMNRSQKAAIAAHVKWNKNPRALPENTQQNQTSDSALASPGHMLGACSGDASQSQSQTDDDDDARARPGSGLEGFKNRILDALGADPETGVVATTGRVIGGRFDMADAARWLEDLRLTQDEAVAVVADTMRVKRDGPPSSFRYFDAPMAKAAGRKTAPRLSAFLPDPSRPEPPPRRRIRADPDAID